MIKQRTEMTRKAPMSRGAGFASKKPAAEPKVRTRKCVLKDCRKPFEPRSMTHKACSPECALEHAGLERKRANRKELMAFREKNKKKAAYVADAQKAFNAWVRERDADQPCICCGKFFDEKDHVTGGQFDAGHYLSRGHAPHLRFDERNVHRQLKGHNRPGGTTRASFRKGMEERIGLEALLALEADVTPRHYSIDDLKAMKAHYVQKLKDLRAKRKAA